MSIKGIIPNKKKMGLRLYGNDLYTPHSDVDNILIEILMKLIKETSIMCLKPFLIHHPV
jgi:hypothetical protein